MLVGIECLYFVRDVFHLVLFQLVVHWHSHETVGKAVAVGQLWAFRVVRGVVFAPVKCKIVEARLYAVVLQKTYKFFFFKQKTAYEIGIPVSVVTDCDIKPEYNTDPVTRSEEFNAKETQSVQKQEEKNSKYTTGSIRGFTSPRWTLEYCIALSSLSDDFHKAVHYGKKILNAQEHISLTDAKIDEANRDAEAEAQAWNGVSFAERAYHIYKLMLNGDGKSSLKAITAQCLASLLRWKISIVPDGLTQEKMFDLELYGFKTDEDKKAALKSEIENDPFLSYIVNAIKYAAGETV